MVNEYVADKGYRGINPMQFGYERCERSHAFGPAVRTYYLLHYVADGRGVFRTSARTYHLSKGDIFVIRPYEQTYYEADADDPWEYIWIGFTADAPLPLTLADVITCPSAGKVFESMKRCRERHRGKTEFLCGKLWELLSVLMDMADDDTDYVDRALNLIHIEYVNGITVGAIAEQLRLDRSYLSVIFKRRLGVSPAEYLIDYRMRLAAELLVDKGMRISLTAASVGYTDVYTFSKAFKKHMGLSPRAFVAAHSLQSS